jgi:protein-disulfide isomerase
MKKFILTSVVGVLITTHGAFAAESSGEVRPAGEVVLVEINGAKVTLAELERKHPTALFQARNTFHEAQRKAVEGFVDEYLLEQQAKKENVTVAQLLEKHVNGTIAKDPSEEALHVYFEGVDTKEPYEAVRGKIIDALRQRRIAKAKSDYMQSLRDQSKVSYRVAPPRAQISMQDTVVRGGPDARVLMVEYADYECPYCQQIQPTLDKLEAEFKGQLAFAYKDMPLPMHPNAPKAAEATRCAQAQGKYWEYHDLLVKTKQLEMPALKDAARTLKLDATVFDKCLDSGEKLEAVQAQASEAQSLGVQGTPSFLINGRYFSGAPSYEQLRAIIAEEIGAASPAPQQSAKR